MYIEFQIKLILKCNATYRAGAVALHYEVQLKYYKHLEKQQMC